MQTIGMRKMADFVGDNPVVASGSLIARGDEQIVVGDDAGHSLTLRWSDADAAQAHGSPSAAILDLPGRVATPLAGAFVFHAEGVYLQLRYSVEPLSGGLRRVTYTMIEDMAALLAEAEAPGLVHHAPGEATRMSVGPG
ncbi:hypothetical protein E2493_03345 [Sphingomonas parva]|uniref:Uncharacterized protein n=1 Tax=Sphingomonas parva TaxID=2555898 RepID=A0A4Y8ZWV0_9SPHN|nr:hypothetical protein [Sphingomonas parva]TFI59665.1 hypothetical protein E2493_03345 [Sphingomonas parva]